jgi:hypothetical protein
VRETRVFVFVERVLEGEEYRVLSDEWGGAVQTGHNLKSREDNINRVRHTVNPAGVSVCACPRQVRGKSEKTITAQEGPNTFLMTSLAPCFIPSLIEV